MGIESWTDEDYALAAIDMLPGSVEEIEEFLRGQRITGKRLGITECPIAVWMNRWTGGIPGTDSSVRVVGLFYRNSYDSISFPLPLVVANFILAFDRGVIKL